MSDYREIPLTQGQVALVDAADFEWLNQWKWYALWDGGTKSFYATRKTSCGGSRTCVLMHREILGLHRGDGLQGDHINHATLDNRRSNLRIATDQQNKRNRRKQSNNVSGYKGVSWFKTRNKFRAQIKVAGKVLHLGYFATAHEAHVAYRQTSQHLYGEFACVD